MSESKKALAEEPSNKRVLAVAASASALLLAAVGGIAAYVWGGETADSTTLIAATPLTDAPPYAQKVSAAGCAQTLTVTSVSGSGILVQNTGSYPMRMNPAGTTAQPEFPLAPKAWIHYIFRKSGEYKLTGTRVGVCAGYSEPHFTLTVTVP